MPESDVIEDMDGEVFVHELQCSVLNFWNECGIMSLVMLNDIRKRVGLLVLDIASDTA